jgi:hypothetical protein
MERLAAVYDIGLVGETGATLNRRIALTNKLFTFILSGIPAVISDIPAHREFALRAGPAVRLYPADSAQELAMAFDYFLRDGGSALAPARAHAHALGQQSLNWELEQSMLVERVEEALSCPP